MINFTKKGDKILDTHLGSGASRIAAFKCGLDFYGFEIDKDYYNASEKWYINYAYKQFMTLTGKFDFSQNRITGDILIISGRVPTIIDIFILFSTLNRIITQLDKIISICKIIGKN